MDVTVLDLFNDSAGQVGWLDRLISWSAQDLVYVLMALVVLAWFWPGGAAVRIERQRLAAYAVVAAILSFGLVQVIGQLWYRDRPFVHYPVHLLFAHAADTSFPSDHATGGFALATPFVLARKRLGWLLVAIATLISVARVAAGIHFPSDVIAGAALGAGVATVIWWARVLIDPPLNVGMALARRCRLA